MSALDTLPLSDFKEHVDSRSVATAGAAIDNGRSVRQWRLDDILYTDVPKAIVTILGGTQIAPFDGRIHRVPPLADPHYPYWYADSITNIQGDGRFTVEAVGDLGYEVPPFPDFAAYTNYVFTVQSTPRPYSVAIDATLGNRPLAGSWYDDGGVLRDFHYWPEWLRYTDYELTPQNDNITSQRGNMVFQSTDPTVNNKSFVGMPRMFIPNSILHFKWFQVPYRYISSTQSYIRRWRGRINQNPWYGFTAGSLLYLNYGMRRYTPPVPELIDRSLGGLFPSTDKLCDIELTFLHTDRTASDLPDPPMNHNFVQAGHNLLPWLIDRSYHFAMSIADSGGNVVAPSFRSFPLEGIFTDPDIGGGP